MLDIRIPRANASVPLFGLLAAALLFSAPASAQFQRNASAGVIVYADPNFHGVSQTLRGDIGDLRPYGLNDQVSSIEIPAGQRWEVCQDVNYQTTCQILTGSVADLRTIGWDDRISSLRQVDDRFRDSGNQRGGNQNGDFNDVIVYADPNFQGANQTLRGDTADLRPYRLNDQVSSIEIPVGQRWEVCQDVNYQTTCQILTRSVADLRTIGWDDRISSLRQVDDRFRNGGNQNGDFRDGRGVFSRSRGSETLIFYDGTGYRGASTVITGDANNVGSIANRRMGSVEVRSGTWQLCDRTGRCTIISQSVPDLSQLGLNGQITSVRPVNNVQGRQEYPQRRDDGR